MHVVIDLLCQVCALVLQEPEVKETAGHLLRFRAKTDEFRDPRERFTFLTEIIFQHYYQLTVLLDLFSFT